MYIDLTPEQKTLRQTLRTYFENLMTPDQRQAVRGMEGGKAYREMIRQIGKRRLARRRLAEGIRRRRPHDGRADDLPRRAAPRERAVPLRDRLDRRSRADGLRNPGAEARVPAAHPRGRVPFLDRLQRAERGHRSREPDDRRREGRQGMGHQRHEDVHERCHRHRLHLARRAHRPERPEAQGHHDVHRARDREGLQRLADPHHRRLGHRHELLRERPRAGGCRRRRRERRLEAHHDPAEPRARRPRGLRLGLLSRGPRR